MKMGQVIKIFFFKLLFPFVLSPTALMQMQLSCLMYVPPYETYSQPNLNTFCVGTTGKDVCHFPFNLNV